MTTKQINDALSFVAMVSREEADLNKAYKWIEAQNFDPKVTNHIKNIITQKP